MMDENDVACWLRLYIEVWRSGKTARVTELFTEAAEYHTDPFRPPRRGHEEIAAYWEDSGDAPDAFDAPFDQRRSPAAPLISTGPHSATTP